MVLLIQLTLKSKLTLMLLAVSICSIVVIAYLSYSSAQSNLTQRAFNQLTSLRSAKVHQIESYFDNIRNQIQIFSEDRMIVTAMQEFKEAYRKLENARVPSDFDDRTDAYYRDEFIPRLAQTSTGTPLQEFYTPKTTVARYLQYHYIAANPNPVGEKQRLDAADDGSEYSRIHGRYHPIFRDMIEKFGYYDMFLIDPETGAIVYTVFKEIDYATRLTTGPYSETNLAQVATRVRRTKTANYVQIIDFQAYSPSYGAPGAFLAAPIYDGSDLVGILAFQLPVHRINDVMTHGQNWKREGLGNSGEIYLIGSDYRMRSLSRFLIEDPQGYKKALQAMNISQKTINRIEQYGTSILQQEVRSKTAKAALAGKEGTQIVDDYRGVPVLSSYAPLHIEGLNWAIVSQMDLAEAYAPIYAFQKTLLIAAASIVLLVALISIGLANLLVRPITALNASARQVSEGKSDSLVSPSSQDELGDLAESLTEMVNSFRIQTELIERKNRENEALLSRVFPGAIAQRLKSGEKDIADTVSNVTVLLSDLVGFTALAESLAAGEALATLNSLVVAFDEVADKHGVEKIKTIGDGYVAVCGLSVPHLEHEKRMVDFALDMLAIVNRFNYERELNLTLRIGINSGEIVAGVVGQTRLTYDIWGKTINLASYLKSVCPSGEVLLPQHIRDRLQELYDFEQFGELENRGKPLVAWRLKRTRSTISPTTVAVS